ncbi:hypothetical protein GEV33_000974 [Tenebrio molitor]|uniref:Beta-hexosaminidase eukaryotic type N-terminal domain-containing protein n=1 Tax=Tenebrio molitor TaxID=7067 RepID=A0A8J6HX25_TENMO|nr:hypothetical protein GEV33_000974 [Tenebrio molitor]
MQRVWPRASAAAERLWSAANVKNITDAKIRIEEHACRMNRRGIEAQPPNGPGVYFIYKPGPVVPASQGQIWPKPQHEDKLDDGYFSLLPSFFQFKSTGNTCSILKEGLDRYRNIILFNNRLIKQIYFKVRTCKESSDTKFQGFLSSLEVELTGSCDDDEFPTVDMNEEYVLNVTSDVQKLSSGSVWGVLRGLETFSQLVYLSDDNSCVSPWRCDALLS